MKTDQKYVYWLTLLYFIVSLAGILHHELWLDEAHHWLLARDSNSLDELYANTRLEGHPLTWNLLLYAITRFTSNPFWMQLLHILIASAAAFVFLKKAPFGWIFKTLFIFGYFMVFEYDLISRNYMPGVLCLLVACSVFAQRNKKFVLLSFYLALAANMHLMFSVIAAALFLALLIENYGNRKLFKPAFVAGYIVFWLGLLLVILQIKATDSGWLLSPIGNLTVQHRLMAGLTAVFKGIFMIPDFRTIYFWNSNYIINTCRPLAAALALFSFALPLLLLRNRKTLYFVYAGFLGMQLFFFVTQRTAARFYGMAFLILIIALWIDRYFTPEAARLTVFLRRFQLDLLRKPIIYGILLIHFCSGLYAWALDYTHPFTAAKETVNFLKKQQLDNREIVTVTCDGTVLSAYLGRKIWFLCDGGYRSFCHWDNGCIGLVSRGQSVLMLNDFMSSRQNAIFVSYYPLSDSRDTKAWIALNADIKVRFLKQFSQTMIDKTSYYVFKVSKI